MSARMWPTSGGTAHLFHNSAAINEPDRRTCLDAVRMSKHTYTRTTRREKLKYSHVIWLEYVLCSVRIYIQCLFDSVWARECALLAIWYTQVDWLAASGRRQAAVCAFIIGVDTYMEFPFRKTTNYYNPFTGGVRTCDSERLCVYGTHTHTFIIGIPCV